MENTWFYWALASAFFAALTAVFAKAGLQDIDSDFATFIRTLVILAALAAFLSYAGKWQGVTDFSARNWMFLILSGLAQAHLGWLILRPCRWARPQRSRLWINSVSCWWRYSQWC